MGLSRCNKKKGLETVCSDLRKEVAKPKYNNELFRYLTADQLSVLLDHFPDKCRPVVKVAINTGLRRGELLAILWPDVNWPKGMLTMCQTKTGKFHQVPLNSHVQEILATLQSQSACESGERIFALGARYLRRRVFDRAVKRAGLAPFRFHDLRYTFASRLAMQRWNDRTIMELGRWGSPRMLKRYAHVAPVHLLQGVEGVNRTGTGSKTGSVDECLWQARVPGLSEIFKYFTTDELMEGTAASRAGMPNWSDTGQ